MEQIIFPNYQIGENIIASCGPLLKTLGQKALVVHGQKALAAVKCELEQALTGLEADFFWYGGECTYEHAKQAAVLGQGKDFVIGVGGGKALDTAKACAHLLGVPVITIPTIASTCAAVTALSVMYDEHGVHIESMFHEAPPLHAVIDLSVIAHAPLCYLRAGVGDSLAKYVECSFAVRGRTLSHSCATAAALTTVIRDQLLRWGEEAFRQMPQSGEALKQVVLVNAVTTGLVSLLIEEHYNGALAHALFYGLTQMKGFETRNLHGDAVGYGVLVQLMLDGKQDEFVEIRRFFQALGLPLTMRDMGLDTEADTLALIIPATLRSLYKDRLIPYDVTEEMLKNAILAVETA